MGRQIAVACVVAGSGLLLAAPAEGGGQAPPPCSSDKKVALTLVAPKVLPVRYPSGFWVQRNVPPYGDAHGVAVHDLVVSISPAQPGGSLRHGYSGSLDRRDRVTYRWPLRFEPGDGPARVTVTYTEGRAKPDFDDCTRELSKVVMPQQVADPHPRVGRTHWRYWVTTRGGIESYHGRAWTRGHLLHKASRPVLIEVYEGSTVVAFKRVRARHRRFSAAMTWGGGIAEGMAPVKAHVLYPGDVQETWPCYDAIYDNEPPAECTMHTRLHRPDQHH